MDAMDKATEITLSFGTWITISTFLVAHALAVVSFLGHWMYRTDRRVTIIEQRAEASSSVIKNMGTDIKEVKTDVKALGKEVHEKLAYRGR